jgi:hypothetical protein
MAKKKKINNFVEFDWHGNNYSVSNINSEIDRRDFSILEHFTIEELAQEILRRTSLGKELE